MSSVDVPARLLSPMRRRIYPNPTSSKGSGIGTAAAMNNLVHAGWRGYFGPAKTDERGWVIPGTDPAVVPAAPGEAWK